MIFRSPHPPITVPYESFSDYLLGSLGERHNKLSFIEASTGRALTYRMLKDQAAATAVGLTACGLERGGVAAICSPNLPEYAVAFHAIAMAGGCSTTLSPLATEEELAGQVRDSGARHFITVPPLLDKARAVAAQTDVDQIIVIGDAGADDGVPTLKDVMEEGAARWQEAIDRGDPGLAPRGVENPATDLLTLPYSSGTTGRSKGVMLTHRNVVANIEQITSLELVKPGDKVIAVIPFFHIYGMVVVMSAALRVGATVLTMPRFDLVEMLEWIQAYRATCLYLVPPIVLALAKHPIVDDYRLNSVRWIMSGAAPLGEETALACEERLGCRVFQGYGMTEASPVTHLCFDPDGAGDRISTVGRPIPSTEMMIVDLETGEPQGPGGEGELWLRGPQVMQGYLNSPEATAQTVDEDGWLHSGDVAVADEDGYTTIVDRAKELIKYKGYQVAPAELEDVLLSHPHIADAAVVPVPDEEAGELPMACVVRAPGEEAAELTEEDVTAHVAGRVAPYKKVRRVEFVDEIPKSASGKILRRILVERQRAAAEDASAGGAP